MDIAVGIAVGILSLCLSLILSLSLSLSLSPFNILLFYLFFHLCCIVLLAQ